MYRGRGRGRGGRGRGRGSPAIQPVNGDGSFTVNITTLKGEQFNQVVTASMTVLELKRRLRPNENASSVKIIVGSKMMTETKNNQTPNTLADYHVSPRRNELKLVSRFEGGVGNRKGLREVCHQLRWMEEENLGRDFLGVEPLDDGWSWNVLFRGPQNTPYQGFVYEINIAFPHEYPSGAPDIKFITPIFHPNVYSDGELCWHEDDTSGSRFYADIIFAAVLALLQSPNPSSPANTEAAHLFNNNYPEYRRKAREHAQKHAYGG